MKEKNLTAPSTGEINYYDLDPADRAVVEKAVRKGYSRREILKLMMATGVTAAAANNLFSSGGAAMAATPKKGGSLRMASRLHGPDDQRDPQLFTSTIDYIRGNATYNGLCQISDNLALKPELATEWGANANATEWTFKLRKGVTFHDGSKMTADDVVYTMNRHGGEESKSAIKSVLASVKEWKKSGRHEVKAILHGSNADLPILTGLFNAKIIKKGTNGDNIGTGPYVMESFEPGVKSVHKRNENYWREGANMDALEITAITDAVARVNAIISGDMQMIDTVEPTAFRQIESAKSVKLLSTPAAAQVSICCLKNTQPGMSDDFVKGMQFIQDREHIVSRILKGKGSVGNDTPIMKAHGADFCHELSQRQYDPDKAKFHFKKAGVSEAELFVAPVTSGIVDTCLLAQANCAKIGFKLNLKRVPTDGYWGNVWLKEPLNVVFWNQRPTAQSQMAIQFAPGAKWNDTYWNNDRMGKLLASVLAETDPAKRHSMMCEMQTLIHENSGIVTPAFTNINDAIADNVMGIPKNLSLGPLGGNSWPEFVWLA